MLNTILFDLDGTLAPFVQDAFVRTYFKALLRRIVPMGYGAEQFVAALWKGVDAMVANDGTQTNRQRFWAVFAQELGSQALALESILNDFYSGEFDTARVVLKEEVDRGPLIRGLREKGYAVVLATNPIFPAVAVETRLRWVGLTGADFEWATTYENSCRSKPNPGYYLDLLERIGKRGEECLMIGNNPVDDMAALEAGLSVYLVTDCIENPSGVPVEKYPHGSFRMLEASLEKLPEI